MTSKARSFHDLKRARAKFPFYAGIFVFLSFAVFGFRLSISAWGGMVYVSDLKLKGIKGRVPAAIRKEIDFSRLDGVELMTASQKRLLTAARVVLIEKGVGIEFGQFIIRAEDGQRQLACDYYDRVHVVLEADGVAVSGEKPSMEIDAPCATSSDLARTEPIYIPSQEIMKYEPSNTHAAFESSPGTSFTFAKMTSHWPRRWAVTEVKLYRESEPGREVEVDQADMRELSRKPLTVVFP